MRKLIAVLALFSVALRATPSEAGPNDQGCPNGTINKSGVRLVGVDCSANVKIDGGTLTLANGVDGGSTQITPYGISQNGVPFSGGGSSLWDGGTGWPRVPPIDSNTFLDFEFGDYPDAGRVVNTGTAGGFLVPWTYGAWGPNFGEPIGNGQYLPFNANQCWQGFADGGPGIGQLSSVTTSMMWD
jgi:hypothetical protein